MESQNVKTNYPSRIEKIIAPVLTSSTTSQDWTIIADAQRWWACPLSPPYSIEFIKLDDQSQRANLQVMISPPVLQPAIIYNYVSPLPSRNDAWEVVLDLPYIPVDQDVVIPTEIQLHLITTTDELFLTYYDSLWKHQINPKTGFPCIWYWYGDKGDIITAKLSYRWNEYDEWTSMFELSVIKTDWIDFPFPFQP